MPVLSILLPDEYVTDALTMVFLHSIWQFTLITAIISVVLKKNWIVRSSYRYAAALLSMTGLVFCAVLTFFWYYSPVEESTVVYSLTQLSYPEDTIGVLDIQTPLFWLEKYKSWILTFWITGTLLLGIKWLSALIYIQWLKKSASYPGVENPVLRQWNQVRAKWGIHKNIRLGFTRHIQSPVLIGQIKPVILFPVSLVNRLSPEEVEFILLHELAHYARCDWWANMLQSMVEAVFLLSPGGLLPVPVDS